MTRAAASPVAPPVGPPPALAPAPESAWQEAWRAEDFDLAIQQSTTSEGWSLHRVVAMGGRADVVAICRRPAAEPGARQALLVPIRRPAIGADLWELPRGFGDETDDCPEQTALREYREETGRQATIRQGLGQIYPDSGLLANPVHVALLDDTPCRRACGPRRRGRGERLVRRRGDRPIPPRRGRSPTG